MPALAGITVERHVLHPDGRVELVLLVPDADPEMLGDVGGYVAAVPAGTTVSYTWGPGMVPANPVAVCTAAVARPLLAWASAWYGGRIDLTA